MRGGGGWYGWLAAQPAPAERRPGTHSATSAFRVTLPADRSGTEVLFVSRADQSVRLTSQVNAVSGVRHVVDSVATRCPCRHSFASYYLQRTTFSFQFARLISSHSTRLQSMPLVQTCSDDKSVQKRQASKSATATAVCERLRYARLALWWVDGGVCGWVGGLGERDCRECLGVQVSSLDLLSSSQQRGAMHSPQPGHGSQASWPRNGSAVRIHGGGFLL